MANFTDKIKSTWFKCMETLGQSASNFADNAKQRLDELNMDARRKELQADLPGKVMQMWKDGVELPDELNQLLTELNVLEEELNAARAARLAKKAKPAITDGSDAEATAEEADTKEAAEDVIAEAAETVEETIESAIETVGEAAAEAAAKAMESADEVAQEATEAVEEAAEQAPVQVFND